MHLRLRHTSRRKASSGTMPKCSLSGVYNNSEDAFNRNVFQLAGMESRKSTSVSGGIDNDEMKFLHVTCLRLKESQRLTRSLW
jgi:hypothetical protein